jgi:hypothetical protein
MSKKDELVERMMYGKYYNPHLAPRRYSISQLQSFATITDLIAYYGTHDYTGVDEWGSVRARFAHPVHDPAQLRTAHIQPHPGPEESPSPTSDVRTVRGKRSATTERAFAFIGPAGLSP